MIGGDLVARLKTELLRYGLDGSHQPERFLYRNGDGVCCDYQRIREEIYDGLSGGEKVIVDVAEVLDRADATLDPEHRQMVMDAALALEP